MTSIEKLALEQAVKLLEQAATDEGQSLFQTVVDHSTTAGPRLFQDYLAEDEWWAADHLIDGVINHVRLAMIDEGYRLPE
jgi:hypothetical protein